MNPNSRAQLLRFGLLAFAVLLPLGAMLLVNNPAYYLANDTMSYVRPGAEFWQSGRYFSPYFDRLEPEMDRTPAYAILVGFFYREGTGTSWVTGMLALQLLFRLLTVVLILTLPLRGTDRKFDGRILAAAFVVLDIPSTLLVGKLLTETLSTFLVMLTVWLYFRWRQCACVSVLIFAGIVAGISVLCRPINLFLPVILTGAVAWEVYTLRRPRVLIAGFLLGALLFPGAWMARNASYAGRPVISLTGSRSLLFYRAAGVLADSQGADFAAIQAELQHADSAIIREQTLRPWEAATRRSAQARDILREHKALVLRQTVNGFLRAMFDPGKSQVYTWVAALNGGDGSTLPDSPGVLGYGFVGWGTLHLAGIYLLIVWVCWRAVRQRHLPSPAMFACLGTALLLVLAASGPESYSRFRLPVMPLLALVAVWPWLEENKQPPDVESEG